MSYIKRIGSFPQKFDLELTIHSIHFNLPYPGQVQLVAKRSKDKKETTPILNTDVSLGVIFPECTLCFRVTMYQKNSFYLTKELSLRLVQVSPTRKIKNGKVVIDLSPILNSKTGLEMKDFKLKGCTYKNASVCVSGKLTRVGNSVESTSTASPEEFKEPPQRSQRRSKTEKEEKKAKFMQRIERLNSMYTSEPINTPKSAGIVYERETFSPLKDNSDLNPIGEEQYTTKQADTPKSAGIPYEKLSAAKDSSSLKPISEESPSKVTSSFIETTRGNPKRAASFYEVEELSDSSSEESQEQLEEPQVEEFITPPVSIQKVKPNTQSKSEFLARNEAKAGLNNSRKGSACSKCLLF